MLCCVKSYNSNLNNKNLESKLKSNFNFESNFNFVSNINKLVWVRNNSPSFRQKGENNLKNESDKINLINVHSQINDPWDDTWKKEEQLEDEDHAENQKIKGNKLFGKSK